jgi:hypothetical protein
MVNLRENVFVSARFRSISAAATVRLRGAVALRDAFPQTRGARAVGQNSFHFNEKSAKAPSPGPGAFHAK